MEDHARKQVQMHAIVQKLSKMFNDAIPPDFGETFSYRKVFFTTLGNLPVTMEEVVPGKCVKYNNNDGACEVTRNGEFIEIFEKAQTLSYCTCVATGREMMLLD